MNSIERKLIPYGRHEISEEDIQAVVATLRSDFLTQGPKVAEFEKKFADYVGAKFAVAVCNGTAALHLSVLALGLQPGQRIITTPISFVATANCILYCGALVDFVDIDPTTGTIDVRKLRLLLETSPKGKYSGVIPVDLAGYPVDMEQIRNTAAEHGLWVLEDACHAPGGFFVDSQGEKQPCGSCHYADAAVFSFHPVKHIATGEGGMITTNSTDIYEKLLLLRTHGITRDPEQFLSQSTDVDHGGWYYEMQTIGYNYRLPDILAALGVSQLARAAERLKRRREIAQRYDEVFQKTASKIKPLVCFENAEGHAYHLYVILVKSRKQLYDTLRVKNIFAQVHYIPIHLQPYYAAKGFKKGMFPEAESYYAKALSLPMYPGLADANQKLIIETVLTSL